MQTSQGRIAILDTKLKSDPSFPTIVFLHGHLTDKSFFSEQLDSPLFQDFRLIALDMPGYGESEPPCEPEKVYSFPGFADVVAEVIDMMKLDNFIIVGWSLGGHVGIELTLRLDKLKGLLITGTPPIEISNEGLSQGFKALDPEIMKCFGKGNLTLAEAQQLAKVSGYDYSDDKQFLIDAIFRSDEGAKTLYPASISKGIGMDQRAIVQNWPKPIAVIAGEDDIAINYDYVINEVKFRNLWKGKVHVISNADHVVHMEKPEEFNPLLKQFAVDVLYRT